MPPKHLWYQPWETLFTVRRDNGYLTWETPVVKQAVFGIRPCDVHALLALDEVFLSHAPPDPYYQGRRQGTFILAANCIEAGETCFCASMGTGPGLSHDYDLLLTELDHEFLLEVGSEPGAALACQLHGKEPTTSDWDLKEHLLQKAAAGSQVTLNTDRLPEIMQSSANHPYWEEVTAKCFACANCTSVCPTCYCADIFDETDLSLHETKRKRRWSWCFLVEFGAVHGGNFRESRIDRLKQFMQHKLNFSVGQYDFFHCVGCGRCIVWCPANIDIAQTARVIRGDEKR